MTRSQPTAGRMLTGRWRFLLGAGLLLTGQAAFGQAASQPVSILATSQVVQESASKAKPTGNDEAAKANARKNQEPVPDARIAELMTFVEANHPEIRPLLRSLQRKRPLQFENAMRGLDREVRNLQLLKERSPERYRRSLEQWTNNSKTKLLAAQLAVTKSDREAEKIRKRMNVLINQYFDSRAEQLKEDIAALEARSSRLKTALATIQEQRDEEVKRQFDLLTRQVPRVRDDSNPARTTKPKPPGTNNPDDRRKSKPGSEGGSGN